MKRWLKTSLFILFISMLPAPLAYAETLEEQMNNLIGPQKNYNTMLSPVYLNNNKSAEYINPQSGELSLTQTDYVLPGRNGLNLEIKRIYQSGISNVQQINVKYVNGAWVDYVEPVDESFSFYEDRYNLGIGMRFSFPGMEIRKNEDGTSHKFLHTESGDIYRLKNASQDGHPVMLPEGQTVKDVVIRETTEFNNGQTDGSSKYVMTDKEGKKTYFALDGAILGIVDRYGNTITFQHKILDYTVDGKTTHKKLISKIVDTVGRITTIDYKENDQFKVGAITNPTYGKNETYKATQNPNNVDSGDLQGQFQVIVNLPGDNKLVYDKSAVLVNDSKHVVRTRLQRVFDVDGSPKYHFWYEQPDLGFTFVNGTNYGVYNRYENLMQVDYVPTNHITRYIYNTFTKGLSEGSMQYRKIFEKRELIKKDYDASKAKFEDRFTTEVKNKTVYSYTNEADGYKVDNYNPNDNTYLKDKFRYYTETTDAIGNKMKYTFDGLHQLILTENTGKDHKEVVSSERDELKLVKKQETLIYQTTNSQSNDTPVKRIENYRYDEYGNLTNYTGPEAERDSQGYPVNNDHLVVYAYAYDKFHVLASKTWKKDKNSVSQILYAIDTKGNVTRETKMNAQSEDSWTVTDYQYDSYGNMTRQASSAGGQSFVTQFEYGVDANGLDMKGAYVTKQYGSADGEIVAKSYAYDFNTGNRKLDVNPNKEKTSYTYDKLGRVTQSIEPDKGVKGYSYVENPYANLSIQYTDPNKNRFQYEYDIMGNLLKAAVEDSGEWLVLQAYEYDALGLKTKEVDANGNSFRLEYDSNYRLTKRSSYEQDKVNKGELTLQYKYTGNSAAPLIVILTNEEGYSTTFYYDLLNRPVKVETTPDHKQVYTTSYEYDFMGNLLRETDGKNGLTAYSYDNMGRLIEKKDALGNETSYAYNALDQLKLQQDPGKKVTEVIYDALGRVAEQRIYTKGEADYTYTRHDYDLAGNPIRTRMGKLTGTANAVASDVSYTYDAMNRVTDEYAKLDGSRTAHVKYAYDLNGNKLTGTYYTDAAETSFKQQLFTYNFAGQVTKEEGIFKEKNGSKTEEHGSYRMLYDRDLAGNVIKQQVWSGDGYDTILFTYNYRNQVIEKVEPFGGKANGKRTVYRYDKLGQLLTETLTVQGTDLTQTMTYDGLGRMATKSDALGNRSRYAYDANGKVVKESDGRYSAWALDEAPGTLYEYDALNRMTTASSFDGKVKEVVMFKQYDERGNVIKDVKGEGYTAANPSQSNGTAYQYDANDRVIAVISAQTGADNASKGTTHYTSQYVYDALGNVISETDALGRKTSYSYYLNGLLKEKAYPDGSKESYNYDLTGKTLVSKKDQNGNVTTVKNNVFEKPYQIEHPDGTVESMSYSAKGELIEKVDQAGQASYYRYDSSSNLVAEQAYISSNSTSTQYKLTEHQYDEANRLLSSETFSYKQPKSGAEGTKAAAGDKITNSYDKAGRVLSVSGPNGRETLQQYDEAGNMTLKRMKVASGDYDITRYAYDVQSRMLSESLLVKMDELVQAELADAAVDDAYYDRVLATTVYSYDKSGNVVSQTDPKGYVTKLTYDLDNRVVKRIDPLGAATTYTYDEKGNLVEEKNPLGLLTRYDYDELDRVIRKKLPAADGTEAVTRYLYDANGNVIKEILPNQYTASMDRDGTVKSMKGLSYTYDAMNRLTSTTSPEGKGMEYIAYDVNGRISKTVDGLQYTGDIAASLGMSYVYDGLGQLIKQTDALQHSTTFVYDVLGNVTKSTDARGMVTAYAYYPDRLVRSITYADGGVTSYEYDKLGRVTAETNQLGHKTTTAYNAFGQVKLVTDALLQRTESKYDLAGNLVSLKDKRGSISLYAYDANKKLMEKKSPLEQDSSGNIVYAVESYAYDAAGNLIKESLSSSKDEAFLRERTYAYYSNNLLKSESDNSGALTVHEYDKNGNVTETATLRDTSVYDVERFVYDSQDRVTQSMKLVDAEHMYLDSSAHTELLQDKENPGKLQIITGYVYDVLGNVIQEIDPRAFGYAPTDTAGRSQYTTTHTYDAMNRLVQTSRKVNGQDAVKRFAYDENGNVAEETNERGYVTKYAYDELNRVAAVTDGEGHKATFSYDLAGNKIAEANANGHRMTYAYDKLNRLVTVKDPYNIIVTRNVYDAADNLIKVI
ncbi:hypothetical protein, partial [Paenibacillus algorifonticola]